jgi:hypothetical protein
MTGHILDTKVDSLARPGRGKGCTSARLPGETTAAQGTAAKPPAGTTMAPGTRAMLPDGLTTAPGATARPWAAGENIAKQEGEEVYSEGGSESSRASSEIADCSDEKTLRGVGKWGEPYGSDPPAQQLHGERSVRQSAGGSGRKLGVSKGRDNVTGPSGYAAKYKQYAIGIGKGYKTVNEQEIEGRDMKDDAADSFSKYYKVVQGAVAREVGPPMPLGVPGGFLVAEVAPSGTFGLRLGLGAVHGMAEAGLAGKSPSHTSRGVCPFGVSLGIFKSAWNSVHQSH